MKAAKKQAKVIEQVVEIKTKKVVSPKASLIDPEAEEGGESDEDDDDDDEVRIHRRQAFPLTNLKVVHVPDLW